VIAAANPVVLRLASVAVFRAQRPGEITVGGCYARKGFCRPARAALLVSDPPL